VSVFTNVTINVPVSSPVEARGIEKAERLFVIFAKMRKWLYFAVFYDLTFGGFK